MSQLPPEAALATPFVLALAAVGRWLIHRLDQSENETRELYKTIIDRVMPAMEASTKLLKEDLLPLVQTLRFERDSERLRREELERRIREEK